MDYRYRAKILSVIDGDTVKVSLRLKRSRAFPVDLGLHVFIEDGYICVHENLRLLGVNAPERFSPEGRAATAWLQELLPVGLVVDVTTVRDRTEKYGRFLATITRPGDSTTVEAQLVDAGHATPYAGGVRPVV